MKIGDQYVVSIGEFQVAMATIEHIEGDRATILIPATRVEFGVTHSLADLVPEVEQVMLTGPALETGRSATEISSEQTAQEEPVPE